MRDKRDEITEDDNILAAQFKSGDQSAFSQLMNKYSASMFYYAKSMVRNYEDAEDITQDIFVRVFKALPSWEPRASFKTWLYRIAYNRCIDYLRAQSRRRTHSLDDDEQADKYVDTGLHSNPERMARQREIRKHIENALSQLSQQQRDVFILYHDGELQIKEIAEVLGIAEGTVKTHHFRAMRNLRKILGPLRDKL